MKWTYTSLVQHWIIKTQQCSQHNILAWCLR